MSSTSLFATPSAEDIQRALDCWPSVSGRLRPIAVSAFGDVFFERPDGSVYRLDPLEGMVTVAAASLDEFEGLVRDTTWIEENLMPAFLDVASERGITREPHQVFAFAPHPVFTGALRVEQLMPMDLPVWHGIAAQLFPLDGDGNDAT